MNTNDFFPLAGYASSCMFSAFAWVIAINTDRESPAWIFSVVYQCIAIAFALTSLAYSP